MNAGSGLGAVDSGTSAADRLPPEGFGPIPGRQRAMATSCAMLAFFLAILGQSTLATAMPSIVDDLGGFDRYTWLATAYLVASVVAIPIAGRLSDLYGRRVLFIAGTTLFIVGSVPAALAQSMTLLTGFTTIQGAGAGSLIALSFVAIGDLFAPEERGKYLGYLSAVFGVAALAGLVLGGVISDHLTWRGIFVLNIVCGLPVLALAFFFPRVRLPAERRDLDYLGMAVLALAIVPIMVALSLAGVRYEWSSWQVTGALGFGLAMAVLFVVIEARAVSPVMPLEIYRNRTVAISALVSFFVGFGMYPLIFFAPLFFQAVRGASATVGSGLLVAMVLGLVIGSAVTGRMLSRVNARYRLHAVAGTAALTAGTFLLSMLDGSTGYGEAVACVLVAGCGIGSTLTSVTVAVQNSTPYRLLGTVTSALQFYRTISGTLGLAVLGALMGARFSSNLDGRLPVEVRDALLPGQLEAIADNPQNYVGAPASAAPQFAATADNADQLADTLLSVVKAALADSIGHVFLVGAALLVLSVAAALFLRTPRDGNAR